MLAETIAELGHEVSFVSSGDALPPRLDAVMILGPFGPVAPLALRLRATPPAERPLLVWWLTEQLADPMLPELLNRPAAALRSAVGRGVARYAERGGAPGRLAASWAGRFLYYGDLHWLRRHGLLSVLAVPSAWLGSYLRQRGFDVLTAPLGAHASWAGPADSPRDIPVLWLGSLASARRQRHLDGLVDELSRRGVPVTVIDGIRHPPVFDVARAAVLSRTLITINLLRQPWDSNFLRFLLAAPNRVLVISEPQLAHYPVHDGVHLVESPLQRMADTIVHYLADRAAREAITERAYQLVTTELTLARSARTVLDRVQSLRRLQRALG